MLERRRNFVSEMGGGGGGERVERPGGAGALKITGRSVGGAASMETCRNGGRGQTCRGVD